MPRVFVDLKFDGNVGFLQSVEHHPASKEWNQLIGRSVLNQHRRIACIDMPNRRNLVREFRVEVEGREGVAGTHDPNHVHRRIPGHHRGERRRDLLRLIRILPGGTEFRGRFLASEHRQIQGKMSAGTKTERSDPFRIEAPFRCFFAKVLQCLANVTRRIRNLEPRRASVPYDRDVIAVGQKIVEQGHSIPLWNHRHLGWKPDRIPSAAHHEDHGRTVGLRDRDE